MALTNSALSLRLARLALRMVGLGFVFGLLWFPVSGFAGSLAYSLTFMTVRAVLSISR